MLVLIGRVLDWHYVGQGRWILDSRHEAQIPADVLDLWAADEDLEVVKAVKDD
jgi:hypothetical protein